MEKDYAQVSLERQSSWAWLIRWWILPRTSRRPLGLSRARQFRCIRLWLQCCPCCEMWPIESGTALLVRLAVHDTTVNPDDDNTKDLSSMRSFDEWGPTSPSGTPIRGLRYPNFRVSRLGGECEWKEESISTVAWPFPHPRIPGTALLGMSTKDVSCVWRFTQLVPELETDKSTNQVPPKVAVSAYILVLTVAPN